MRAIQWLVLGIFFIILANWFAFIDSIWEGCDSSDNSPATRADITACVNAEIMDPFIMLMWPLGVVCIINAVIGWFYERKKAI